MLSIAASPRRISFFSGDMGQILFWYVDDHGSLSKIDSFVAGAGEEGFVVME